VALDHVRLYRVYGPAILARCRRATGDDTRAAELLPRAFLRAQPRLSGDPVADGDLLDATVRELAADLPGPRLLRDPGPPTGDELARAAQRFNRDVQRRTLPLVERDQRPPLVLRWLWVYAPLFVLVASTGMFLAVRDPMNPERFGGGARSAGFELHDGSRRLATGMTVPRGEPVRVVVVPAGYPYVVLMVGPRVHQRLGPLPRDAGRVEAQPVVAPGDQGELRVAALFSRSPRGLPLTETSVVLKVE
jgi:hypothetical protein